jgi:hypothetical protein
MNTGDRWVRCARNHWRSLITQHELRVFQQIYGDWSFLREQIMRDFTAQLSEQNEPVRKFVLINNQLTAWIFKWSEQADNLIYNLSLGLDKIARSEEIWLSTEADVAEILHLLAIIRDLKRESAFLKMPVSLKALTAFQPQAQNIKSHIALLRSLTRWQLPSGSQAIFLLQELVQNHIAKFQNENDKENNFGLQTLKYLLDSLFVDRIIISSSLQKASFSTSAVILKKEEFTTNILHQYAIGSVLNRIKVNTPCFMFVLEGLFCNPYENSIEQLRNVGENDALMEATIICEYVDGQSLNHYANHRDLPIILKQIKSALALAQQEFIFFHNNLVCENVIVKKFNNPVHITFLDPHCGKIIRQQTTLVPVIVNYSKASLRFETNFIAPTVFVDDDAPEPMPSLDWLRLLTSLSFHMDEPGLLKPFVQTDHLQSRPIADWFESLGSNSLKVLDFNCPQVKHGCKAQLKFN